MNLYLDASALVKLYLTESGSERVRAASEDAAIVCTSILAYVEASSAFARKYREGDLSPSQFEHTTSRLAADWGNYYIVTVSDVIVKKAASFTQSRALRALDALHLASANALMESTGMRWTFLAADQRLVRAAMAEGLEIILVEP